VSLEEARRQRERMLTQAHTHTGREGREGLGFRREQGRQEDIHTHTHPHIHTSTYLASAVLGGGGGGVAEGQGRTGHHERLGGGREERQHQDEEGGVSPHVRLFDWEAGKGGRGGVEGSEKAQGRGGGGVVVVMLVVMLLRHIDTDCFFLACLQQ